MRPRNYLFLALSRKGWGETSLGLEVARQVRCLGGSASFVVHTGGVAALTGSGFTVQELPDHMCTLLPIVLQQVIIEQAFDAIVLSDISTARYTMGQFNVDLAELTGLGLPIIGMDTWEHDITGATVDVFDLSLPMDGWLDGLAGRLVPVPIGRTTSLGAYCAMAEPVKIARSVRNHIRQNLGLGDTDRAVLFCTAGWQHGLNNADGQRLATATPPLLWRYLEAVDPSVRLIHVGPARLNLPDAGTRYLWMPSVAPDDFGRLLASVDLFLSANVSATTVGRAVACGIPTVIVQNSIRARTVMEVEEALSGPLHPIVRTWLNDALPVYPFRLWPLGYWHFLEPLLQENPYTTAIETVELLMGDAVIESCHRLLFDQSYIAEFKSRQARYDELVRKLPSAAQLIDTYVS